MLLNNTYVNLVQKFTVMAITILIVTLTILYMILIGGVGISNMIWKIEHHEYMGFENLCEYKLEN